MRIVEEIIAKAEWQIGKLLKEEIKHGGDRSKFVTNELASQTLKQRGISSDQSSKWQKLAEIPEEEFDVLVKKTNSDRARLSNQILETKKSPEKEKISDYQFARKEIKTALDGIFSAKYFLGRLDTYKEYLTPSDVEFLTLSINAFSEVLDDIRNQSNKLK